MQIYYKKLKRANDLPSARRFRAVFLTEMVKIKALKILKWL
jgi:hypothetical protein